MGSISATSIDWSTSSRLAEERSDPTPGNADVLGFSHIFAILLPFYSSKESMVRLPKKNEKKDDGFILFSIVYVGEI